MGKASIRSSYYSIFSWIVGILVAAGFFIFSSASLGLAARNESLFLPIVLKQMIIGIGGGVIGIMLISRVSTATLQKIAVPFFVISLILTLCVFVPGIGMSAGGAHRWIHLGPITFQPSELLKFAFILILADRLSRSNDQANGQKQFYEFTFLLALVGGALLAQPDTGTFMVFVASGIAMYLAHGGKLRNIGYLAICGLIGLMILATVRPYVKERILTFINPSHDTQGSSYQLRQAMIAIGSGSLLGRGYGQSIQKFNYLPEPIGDSIFAVFAEEFGFAGSALLILVITAFGIFGYKIAVRAPSVFSTLLVVGIVTRILSQSFINISAMIGLIPLTGVPLVFVSHGGTALFVTLLEIGVIFQVLKYIK